jgi:NAD(P)-dependent dehydrogenase (short-subunit alcohol dehydrogenase family)
MYINEFIEFLRVQKRYSERTQQIYRAAVERFYIYIIGVEGKEELESVVEEIPLGIIGTPSDVAEACIYLEKAKFVTGQVLGVNGGMVI